MMITRLFFVLVFVFCSLVAVSATATPLPDGMTTVPLATITNDRDSSVSQINLMLNSQAVVRGIYLQTKPTASSKPSPAQSRVYWLGGIESREGVVLGQGQGVKAILLQGDIKSQVGSGSLTIRYLSNGLFGSYDECRINLRRTGTNDWQLVNTHTNRPVQHIQVQTWALGISTLTNVCPAA